MRKFWERYLVLIIFLGISIVGLAIRYIFGVDSWIWDIWASVDVASAVAMGVMAFLAYREFISSEDEIRIYFNVDDKLIDTGLSILRKDSNRSELLGILGMIQKDPTKRFSIQYLKDKKFLTNLHALQKGKSLKLEVIISPNELAQFEVE